MKGKSTRIGRMEKRGEKQRRKPKLKDKRQSERFKETARQIGAAEGSDAFERIVQQMARTKPDDKNKG